MKNGELIFVYGTLRAACTTGAHQTYLADASFIGNAKLNGKLFKVSYYPALVLDDAGDWVIGEVYQLASAEQLAALDVYEECSYPALPGQEYQRQRVQVQMDQGDLLEVWVYSYQRITDRLEFISSGDFLNP